MKELGETKFILGMEIDHDRTAGTLMIKQTRYIDDVTNRFNQQNAKAVVNPCESGMKLTMMQSPTANAERETMRTKPYRSLIGCLLHITTCTRPDVAYIVTQLSRFLENPGQQHWKAAIRVLRYMKSTKDVGIIYISNDGKVMLEAYTDADWGSNLDNRRSVSGIMIMISGAPVVFESKYQRTVALSSAEAEYMALSLCTQEVLWTRAMLRDVGHEQVGATQVWEDNQGAIALASNAGYNARTKHATSGTTLSARTWREPSLRWTTLERKISWRTCSRRRWGPSVSGSWSKQVASARSPLSISGEWEC
ncbi:unnamed protein product [Phytophthora fragariaefolia]|uniref:Unnamed protein product n=1 Tax=Phytophthora fragariaefolia TaxID=1490495 RepID=A0A9W6YAZ0_9STRA|nr:unnamed protein product [Phytophthora fragariaefolia]